ncbi:HAD-like domain-containing protein [Cantharellus anzutake]|uniref:HAD-like domain-containing protein n=1 Tax=Cantharellus anzutake TaxID=1750568 RepID=UPI001905C4BC|nr:HAD-like domain-containing protein [Cantharellus anzutake]KAF8334235.1 HAD-like domain-containing protein [Cantharellus anzutake]
MFSFIVDAVLFDMDGTLIDSTPGVISAWYKFAEMYQLDVPAVLKETHGVRLVDSLKTWCEITDPETLQKESMRFEKLAIEGGPVVLPGVRSLLKELDGGSSNKWTIVTSGTSSYAQASLERTGIIMPASIVTSEHVSRGKPFPDPYVEGARRCNVDAHNVLVVEDAPSGIRSGHAAGAKTLAVCTSHSKEEILESGANPDYIVQDLTQVSTRWVDGKIEITIRDDSNYRDS